MDHNKKIVWFWRSNLYLDDKDERREWKRYSDFENEFIEDAFQRREIEVQLDGYMINFQNSISFKKVDTHKQRLIKRGEVELHNYIREERFSNPERALKTFDSKYEQEHNFVWQWRKKNEHIASSGRYNYPAIAKLAAQGGCTYTVLTLFRHAFILSLLCRDFGRG